jgi:hypothetical protein
VPDVSAPPRHTGGAGLTERCGLGLVFDFEDGTLLAVPLDGTDAVGPEAAWFAAGHGRLWSVGEAPFESEKDNSKTMGKPGSARP